MVLVVKPTTKENHQTKTNIRSSFVYCPNFSFNLNSVLRAFISDTNKECEDTGPDSTWRNRCNRCRCIDGNGSCTRMGCEEGKSFGILLLGFCQKMSNCQKIELSH